MSSPLDPLAVARRVEELFRQGAISLTTFLEMQRQCLDADASTPAPQPGTDKEQEEGPHSTDTPH